MDIRERIALYDKNRNPIGTIARCNCVNLKNIIINGREVEPWVQCVSCFIIDKTDHKVAIQLRSMNEINDAGELDVCSGHIIFGEINRIAMARRLKEEMTMTGYDYKQLLDSLIFSGIIRMDFAEGSKGQRERRNFKCFSTIYTILIDEKSIVSKNDISVGCIKWIDYDIVKQMIKESRFRFPCTSKNASEYDDVFSNIDLALQNRSMEINGLKYFSEK